MATSPKFGAGRTFCGGVGGPVFFAVAVVCVGAIVGAGVASRAGARGGGDAGAGAAAFAGGPGFVGGVFVGGAPFGFVAAFAGFALAVSVPGASSPTGSASRASAVWSGGAKRASPSSFLTAALAWKRHRIRSAIVRSAELKHDKARECVLLRQRATDSIW